LAINSAFWAALREGLAAPSALFSAPRSYDSYTAVLQPAQCFSIVGAYLTSALPQVVYQAVHDDKPIAAERNA
jgi:hypothetical protein